MYTDLCALYLAQNSFLIDIKKLISHDLSYQLSNCYLYEPDQTLCQKSSLIATQSLIGKTFLRFFFPHFFVFTRKGGIFTGLMLFYCWEFSLIIVC